MPWIGNLFKKWNYPGGWTADATSSIGIEAGRHDTQDSDFADGINACLKKDATNAGFTTNLDFNGYRPTNLAAGSEAAPAICLNNDSDTGVWAPAANVLAISTGGAERIRFNAAGETVTTGTISCNQTSGYPTVAVKSVQAAGYAPGFLEMRRSGASSTATPDNSVLGEIRFTGLNPSASYMNCASITAQIGTNAAGGAPCDLIFWTAPSGSGTVERARIKTSGNVGIGTASPSYLLQLASDSAAKPTTNTWTIASDARIKTNIQNYEKGLAEICQVNPITYDYNGKGGIPAGPGGVSILAQDLQPIFPECVGFYRGKLEEEDEDEIDILNYNGHAITFALINAVKELNAKVEALEARVAELEK